MWPCEIIKRKDKERKYRYNQLIGKYKENKYNYKNKKTVIKKIHTYIYI